MNEKRLLFWLTDIADEYVLEAVECFRTVQRRPRRRLSRLLVLAAAVAAMLAVAAVGYGVSQSMYAKKQEQLRLEYMPHGQEVPGYVEFNLAEEIPAGTHIEKISTVRTHERMQETEYAITSDDPVVLEALIYGYLMELRTDMRAMGRVNSWDEENNTAYFSLQTELPEDAKPGDVYPVEVWKQHAMLWVPEDDPEAEPVEECPPSGNWMHPYIYIGTLEVVVTELYSARVDFGDSLPVELEDGTAYIRYAEILPSQVSWVVELPRPYHQFDVPDRTIRVHTEEFNRMSAAVSAVIGQGAVFFDDGGCWLVDPHDFGVICDENGTICENNEESTFYRTGRYYSGLQNIPAVTGMALGDLFYPVNQTYDPAAVQPAPDYPRNPYR